MKIIGVGLNKTGTKTLKNYLVEMGFCHQSYSLDYFNTYRKGDLSELFKVIEQYDSFEDWPWPLMYKEIDKKFEDAVFILTVRKNPEIWYKSLCKMAVRMGPFNDFEKYIYGYNMPQGKKKEHIDFYNKHNKEVETYFKGRPGKLLKICWGEGDDGKKVAQFLGQPEVKLERKHSNKSEPVYEGENWWIAHFNRIIFQSRWYYNRWLRNLKQRVKVTLIGMGLMQKKG
jgi:sulfotransferase family protein